MTAKIVYSLVESKLEIVQSPMVESALIRTTNVNIVYLRKGKAINAVLNLTVGMSVR